MMYAVCKKEKSSFFQNERMLVSASLRATFAKKYDNIYLLCMKRSLNTEKHNETFMCLSNLNIICMKYEHFYSTYLLKLIFGNLNIVKFKVALKS